MPHTAIRLVPYLLASILAFLAAPWAHHTSVAERFPFEVWGLTRPDSFRLAAQAAALLVVGALALRTAHVLPENGGGCSFIPRLLVPLTLFLLFIAADKAFRAAGAPFTDPAAARRYALAYLIGMVGAALWVTAAWLASFEHLRGFFAGPGQARSRSKARAGPSGLSEEPNGSEEAPSATVVLPVNAVPSTLGRYKVLKEIGRGAMGVVYLGKDPTIQRFVAIKTVRLDQIDDVEQFEQVKARFFREAESTGRLSHPNIVTIFDAGEEEDLGYIAMEVLEGTTLKHWSRKPNLLPPEKLGAILATVADALDYAHQQGVVHRDIKPANIMLTKDDVVKVMDFGIAKTASSARTQTDVVLGTPTYMPPEQIAGKKVDGRSDIFSFGVVLFELLTGGPPFTADNVSALLFAITQNPAPRLAAYRSDVSPRLQAVVSRALEKDPVRRYRRAADFAHELRACLRGSTA